MNILPYINAIYPILYIRTNEHERAYDAVISALEDAGMLNLRLYAWRPTQGLISIYSNARKGKLATEFTEALTFTIAEGERTEENLKDNIYFFFGARSYMQASSFMTHAQCAVMQQLRDCAVRLKGLKSCIIFIGPDITFPAEVQDVITVLDFELPTKEEIAEIFNKQIAENKALILDTPSEEEIDRAAELSVGLSAFKAENAIALSISERECVDLSLLQHEKELAVKQLEVIDFVKTLDVMGNVGGFGKVKEHVNRRASYYQCRSKAEAFGCSAPKGILLVGHAGTGKSLIAKAIASYMNLPLYTFNVGALFKSLVGESESMVRVALRMLTTLSPCVVLFDEFEKMVTGSQSSGRTDSGVTSRVMANLLTWMQDNKDPIYKVATCNTLTNLDSAMFRRGRWDAVFGVDLPTVVERKEILCIHLNKRGRIPDKFNLDALVECTADFVGAEIESAIEEALYEAFYEHKELTTQHIINVCQNIKPIAVTDKEVLNHFRRWLHERAQPASLALDSSSEVRRLRVKRPVKK